MIVAMESRRDFGWVEDRGEKGKKLRGPQKLMSSLGVRPVFGLGC